MASVCPFVDTLNTRISMGCHCCKDGGGEDDTNMKRKDNFRWAEISKCLNTGDLLFLKVADFEENFDQVV